MYDFINVSLEFPIDYINETQHYQCLSFENASDSVNGACLYQCASFID